MEKNHIIFWIIHLLSGFGIVFLNQGPVFNACYFIAWTITLVYLFTYLIMVVSSTSRELFKKHVIDIGPLSQPALYAFSMGLHAFITILFAAAGKYVLASCLITTLLFFTVYRAAYKKCREDMGIKVYSEV